MCARACLPECLDPKICSCTQPKTVPVCLDQVEQEIVNASVPCQVKSKWTEVPRGPQRTVVSGCINCFVCCSRYVLVNWLIWLKLQARSVQHKFVLALV